MQQDVEIESKCPQCGLRAHAHKNPKSLKARLWRWHTKWCPGWKKYVKELESKGMEVPKI